MAVSATKDFWIHPNALTITLNYFDDPQLIQTSMLAGSVILAYNKNYIGYDAAHNYREWKLQAFPTQLNDTCAYYVHAELSRDGDTAMIIYSPVKRDIEGRSFIDGAWDSTTSSASWFIYLGEISASVDADGATVERVWTDGLYTGTLATDQQRLEDAQGDWALMFQLNSATGLIDFLRTVSSATFNALTVAKNFIFGGHTFTSVASTEESGDEKKRNDATLPTTGYVQKEIEALDDHFLIKDGDDPQEVGGDVSFGGDVSVAGEHSIGRNQTIGGDQTVKGTVRISSDRSLGDMALVIGDYFEQGDIIQGAAVDKDGVASFARVKTPSMQVYELVYNRKTAVQGEFVFSDGDTIESITYVCDNGAEYTYEQVEEGVFSPYSEDRQTQKFRYIRAKVHAPYEGYTTTMKEYDILYSNINNIGASGESATTGKCFLRILSDDEIPGVKGVEDDGVTLNVMHYLDEYTPSRFNMLPTPHMTITRHGNEINTSRQDLFLISSEDGRIAQLTGIDSPIVKHDSSYGIVLGRLPYNLIEYIRQAGYAYVKEDQPYLYARGAVIQDLIRIDYKGKVIKTENYRGMWSQSIANGEIEGEDKYASTDIMYDTVTHDGSLWRCNKNETTEEPRGGINDWLLLIAKGADGKDGLTANANLFANTNFDLLESDGETLQIWQRYDSSVGTMVSVKKSDLVVEGAHLGYNAVHKTTSSVTMFLQSKQMVNLQPNVVYTLSCYSKFDGESPNSSSNSNLNTYGYGIVFVGTAASKITYKGSSKVSNTNFGSTGAASEIYFGVNWGNKTDWVRHSVTFTVKEAIPSTTLRFHIWAANKDTGNTFYFSQPKLEVGDTATPYIKGASDYYAPFVSTVFKRSTTEPTTPTGGSYEEPIPTDWFDSIPNGTETLWSSTCTFYYVGGGSGWSDPKMMADRKDVFEAMYSAYDEQPEIPEKFDNTEAWWTQARSNGWVDEPESNISYKWMATNNRTAGENWTDKWAVSQIRGEKGDKGDDATAIGANLIRNADFSKTDSNGTFSDWIVANGRVLPNSYLNQNVFVNTYGITTSATALVADISTIVFKDDYTLSFYCATESTHGILEILVGSSYDSAVLSEAVSVTGEYITASSGGVYTLKSTSGLFYKMTFLLKSITLTITQKVYLRISQLANSSGAPNGLFRISQIKLELGDKATMFIPAEITGPAGKAGVMLYPQGTWTVGATYKRTTTTAPIVYYAAANSSQGTYYILKDEGEVVAGNTPDFSQWEPITNWEAVYTKFIMSNQARFGSNDGGVFYDNLLFSAKMKQGGYYGNGTVNPESETASEVPMLALDFREGKLYAEEAKIRGHIEATSGTIDSITATNLTVNSGKFTGELNATSGKIDSITATGLTVSSGTVGVISMDSSGLSIPSDKTDVTSAITIDKAGIRSLGAKFGSISEADAAIGTYGTSAIYSNVRAAGIGSSIIPPNGTSTAGLFSNHKYYALYMPFGFVGGLRTVSEFIPADTTNFTLGMGDFNVLVASASSQLNLAISVTGNYFGQEYIIENLGRKIVLNQNVWLLSTGDSVETYTVSNRGAFRLKCTQSASGDVYWTFSWIEQGKVV